VEQLVLQYPHQIDRTNSKGVESHRDNEAFLYPFLLETKGCPQAGLSVNSQGHFAQFPAWSVVGVSFLCSPISEHHLCWLRNELPYLEARLMRALQACGFVLNVLEANDSWGGFCCHGHNSFLADGRTAAGNSFVLIGISGSCVFSQKSIEWSNMRLR
jgi:hypothetical protein